MSIRAHVIQANHKSETIHHAVFVDTETHQDEIDPRTLQHRLWFGWAAYTRRLKNGKWSAPQWHRFDTARGFWGFLEGIIKPKRTVYLFSHNTSFDLSVLEMFTYVPAMGMKPTTLCIDSPPTIARFKDGNRQLVLLDTLNWWRQSLAAIGERLGVPKLAMPEKTATQAEWDHYCKRDVEVILRQVTLWADFLVEHDMGGFAPTLAGQSMRAWRHKHMHAKVYVHERAAADELARAAYHGGRCETYFVGRSGPTLHLLDINSMYPAVMASERYPTKLHLYTTLTSTTELRRMLRRYLAVAEVDVTVNEPALPIVQDNKLIFPVGRFKACLSTPELLWCLEHATLHSVSRAAFFYGDTIFKSFVHEMYALRIAARARGDLIAEYAFKILMNSLYGKFGQNGRVWEIIETTKDMTVDVWYEEDPETCRLVPMRQLCGAIERLASEPESQDSMPAIAAHVCAYGRMQLWGLQVKAGREHVFYSDTDSLLVDDVGLERLKDELDPARLGALKLEGTFADWELRGAKDYRLGDRVKIKGVSKSAKQLDENTFEMDVWSGFAGQLRREGSHAPTTRRTVKRLKRIYDKGVVGADGRVSPLTLSEGVLVASG